LKGSVTKFSICGALVLRASLLALFCSQVSLPIFAQLSTADHLAEPGFWPTQDGTSRSEYAGSATCASCHPAQMASQKNVQMAQTAMRADRSEILHSHPEMNFTIGRYHYQIKTEGQHSAYSITDGKLALKETLLWAFGTGRVGQSYLFKKNDRKFYEARVTYFDTLKNLHFTPARALTSPKDIEEAMYRPVDAAEIGRCFACHTTASTIAGQFDEENLTPGVSCEACHGPAAKHVAAAEAEMAGANQTVQGTIFNSAKLIPIDSVDFCGACHTTWWDVKLSGVKGVSTAKSQPYRLEGSKCWGKGDARLTCIACHNPHEPLQTNLSAYDAICSSCHVSGGEKTTASHPGASCPVGTKVCVSCHMQKVYVPEMHYEFTDHRIRIAHANDSYPE
jgi:Cytochrome c554 and c-prime